MSVKVLVIGDPHIKPSNVVNTDILITDILLAISQYDPTFVVVLGDTLHRHDMVDVYAEVKAIEMFEKIHSLKPLVVLIGNHDLPSGKSYLCKTHPFNSLKRWGNNLLVVDTKCEVFEFGGVKFAAVPYVPPGHFFNALNSNTDWRSARAIFAHQELRGCKLNTGNKCSTDGDIWDESLPLVVSGHIHNYQHVGSNIIYVGTPRESSFGDSGKKSISLFNFSSTVEETRIYTTVPELVEVEVSALDLNNLVVPDNRIVKIVIVGTQSEVAAAKKHPIVIEWIKRGIKVTPKYIVPNEPILQPPEYYINSDSTTSSLFIDSLMRRIGDDEIKMSLYKEASS